MVNPALKKALMVVRATTRMKLLLRQNGIDPEALESGGITPERVLASTANGASSNPDSLEAPLLGPSGAAPPGTSVGPSLFRKLPSYHSTTSSTNMARLSSEALALNPRRAPKTLWTDLYTFASLVSASGLSFLLLCVPLGPMSAMLGWGPEPTFVLNLLALIPLALLLGDITEDLALRFGDVVGGLLNATFGNVVELILSIAALEKGLYLVVGASLVGSILSNLLLVLGSCFLFGGLYHKVQTFNATSNRTNSSLLLLSCIGIAMPTAAGQMITTFRDKDLMILWISRCTAIVLLICYFFFLFFQLYTHNELFSEEEEEEEEELCVAEEPVLSTWGAMLMLGLISVLVAVHSEYLTGVITEFSAATGLNQAFIGIIVLPIAGNACEHISAVIVATKNKMELSVGIAIGSSLQIALCVLPVVVLVGWATGHDMSLNLDQFSVLALVLSVIHCSFVTADNQSHWLLGISLIAVYILIAIAFVFQS